MTARYLATQLAAASGVEVPFYNIPADDLTPEMIRGMFAHLDGAGERAVIYVNELAGWIEDPRHVRGSAQDRNLCTALLSSLSGMTSGSGPVLIVATNLSRGSLNPAVIRPGRLWPALIFRGPTTEETGQLYGLHLPDIELDQIDALTQLSADLNSAAEVIGICDETTARAALGGRKPAFNDVVDALLVGGSIYSRPRQEVTRATMLHEWGPAAAASLLFGQAVIRGILLYSGHQAPTGFEGDRYQAEPDMINLIVAAFAGRAGEELDGPAMMASASDMSQAEGAFGRLIENGYWPHLVGYASDSSAETELGRQKQAAYGPLMQWASDAAEKLCRANRANADAFVAAFEGQRAITGDQWRAFLAANPLTAVEIGEPNDGRRASPVVSVGYPDSGILLPVALGTRSEEAVVMAATQSSAEAG